MPVHLDAQPLVVAEIGGNHGGDPNRAAELCRMASKAGARAVKFQAYKTDLFLHPETVYYQDLAREELPFEALSSLIALSHDLGLTVGLTVFGPEGLELAEMTGADYLKISSGDLTYYSLIKQAALLPLPLVMSTGASLEEEITAAASLVPPPNPILLQCTSLYPAPEASLNLAVLSRWLEMGLSAGLSDHSLDITPSMAAMEMGSIMVEKHFTSSRKWPGGDNSMSILPEELRVLACFAKRCSAFRPSDFSLVLLKNQPLPACWGSPVKQIQPGEDPALIRRWAVAARNLSRGRSLSPDDIVYLRVPPGPAPLLAANVSVDSFEVRNPVPKGRPVALADLVSLG
ncbi:MAG: N-acetylneuraminate synthase family protein [Deltaproteobacteria bacterium]|jgi:sialic acid synthase SpsE|nr:N-acetylneuraminate synthase family protein [Deltaproteobacteria bacterium]